MPKLLLADDSPTTQKVVQLTFADEGIEVVIADDGDTAMELYAHHKPDIVLADINMPGLNGYEVCEAIRKRDENGTTPVVLLAGSFEPFDVEEAHRVGANDYLTKPFSSIRRLVATVTALLDAVTKDDTAVEETVEPNSVPPQAVEPDMASTSDIEHLYTQSLVETVEMPHTVAERLIGEAATASSAGPETELEVGDDVAFDDELIETTFAGPQTTEQDVEEHVVDEPSSVQLDVPAGQASASEIPIPQFELPEQDVKVPESEIPTVRFESQEDNRDIPAAVQNDVSRSLPSEDVSGPGSESEEFQIDQSGDEAYFEPAPESGDRSGDEQPEPVQTFSVVPQVEVAAQISEDQAPPESFAIPESQPAVESQQHFESEAESAVPFLEEPSGFDGPEALSEVQATPATPWDSVAVPEPQPRGYQLDGSDLLELPVDVNGRPRAENAATRSVMSAEQVHELTPEIVDQIARATASQISEELVREIAQRIVPKVIEEVMARQASENDDR